jgi:hypothetical protein
MGIEEGGNDIHFVVDDGRLRIAGVLPPDDAAGIASILVDALQKLGLDVREKLQAARRRRSVSSGDGSLPQSSGGVREGEPLTVAVHRAGSQVELHVDGGSVSVCSFIEPYPAVTLAQALLAAGALSGQVDREALERARDLWERITDQGMSRPGGQR